MNDAKDASHTRTLFRIVGLATGLAFGTMVGSLFAVRNSPGGLVFELNAASVIAFLAAGVLAWFYWRMVAKLATGAVPGMKPKFPPRFAAFSAALALIGLAAFLYPLRFIPAEKRADIFIGLLLAVAVLSGVGFVMWKVRNFLEADAERTEREHHSDLH